MAWAPKVTAGTSLKAPPNLPTAVRAPARIMLAISRSLGRRSTRDEKRPSGRGRPERLRGGRSPARRGRAAGGVHGGPAHPPLQAGVLVRGRHPRLPRG